MASERDSGGGPASAVWEEGIPSVEPPDPICPGAGSYDSLTGGARPGGVLNLLWEKVHAEVEDSNQRALAEGLQTDSRFYKAGNSFFERQARNDYCHPPMVGAPMVGPAPGGPGRGVGPHLRKISLKNKSFLSV